ncbi:hypothetical protein OSTOST_11593 [Ostertagia ostertagi]
MKVAEALLNPLGEDDDDFECNFLIDKNIATGLAIVDETYDKCPELMMDRFKDPNYVPVYSEDSKNHGHDGVLVGSAEGINPRNVPIQPVHLSSATPVFSPNPQRPYTAFDLSDGFTSSPQLYCGPHLGKVDEEMDKSRTDSVKSTVESVDENEIPELFRKELNGSTKSNQKDVNGEPK